MTGRPIRPRRSKPGMTGYWVIEEMDEFDASYFDLGDRSPHVTLTVSGSEVVSGEYAIGLSTGSLDGALREFGGGTIFVFGYAGMDEMYPIDPGTARHAVSRPKAGRRAGGGR